MRLVVTTFCLFASFVFFGQEVVSVGAGSYASFPLPSENVSTFANRALNVPEGNTKPIPTNDWWTQVLTENYAGNLWAYPLIIRPQSYGAQLYFPVNWQGQDMVKDYPVTLRGTNFNPSKNIAKEWHDWGLTVNMQDGDKVMDITLGNGIPMAWFEITGFDARIEFGNGATYFNEDGTIATFPFTGNKLAVVYGGKRYGVYAPDNTSFTRTGHTVVLGNPTGSSFYTLATLKNAEDLSYFETFAYSIPRNTEVTWDYQPELAKIDVTYTIITENLKGESENRILQGFLPHHYKNCTQDFSFNGKQYDTPRGLLKVAEGNTFSFSYAFNGVVGHLPEPTVQDIPNPYLPDRMSTMINSFSTVTSYGDDTYWGGKNLLNFSKYALMAKEIENPNFETIKSNAKNAIIDWLTYTPGETSRYFARYENWKGLVGFNPSFGSEQFTDHHFHYGYLIHAASLLAMIDKPFLDDYELMLREVVKEYANWDKNDTRYPYFRTFSPWRGHSYAGGLSSGDGNNQESTSEAMQSWAGMFFLGDVLQDYEMRDAAAFGYLMESRATREYWYDVDDENIPAVFNHSMIGVVFDGGMLYGTWFSNAPLHIHGIQWLPYSPILNYMAEYLDYMEADYNLMQAEQIIHTPSHLEEADYGADWANVALCIKQMFNPSETASQFDEYWDAPNGSPKKNVVNYVTAGQTYYYLHSNRTLGSIQFDYYTSAPNSQVYYNETTGLFTYIGFNSQMVETDVVVYHNGSAIGTITVEPYSFFNTTELNNLSTTSFIEDDIKLYPNPFDDKVTIALNDSSITIQSVQVYGILGNLIEEVLLENQTNEFKLGTNYTSGIYIIKVKTNLGTTSYKLIKK